jgi:tRNA(Ile)-lysidine synthase
MPNDCDPIRPDDLAALFGRCGFMPSLRCALAVSGGSDSTALMVLFADWLRQQGGDVALHIVLTVDHGLRPESAAEARTVTAQAESLGFPHATLLWEGPKPQTGIQAAARQARYRLMGNAMRASGIALLLTGHTRDDRAETFLMRLARGSGLDGLAGMAPRLHFNALGLGDPGLDQQEIARPLLDVPRTRLRATLQARGIAWIDDPSNQSPEFERPRLRAARAQLDDLGLTNSALALSATRLLRARQALGRVVGEFCSPDAGVVLVDPCGYIVIDRARLQAGGEEITLRVLERAIAAAGGSGEQVPLAKLESIVASLFGAAPGTAKWTLARAMIMASAQTVTIEREPGREPLPLLELSPGTRACWDGRFSVSVGAGVGAGTIGVRPLGESAARELYQQGAVTTRIPARAAGMVPSFWQGNRLLAVPTLEFWSGPDCRDALEARFVWQEAMNRLSP